MSDDLQQKLHAAITTTTDMHDLPLTFQHAERLAVDLTPVVKALLATAAAAWEEAESLRCQVTDAGHAATDADTDVEVTEYAGCTTRIGLDVDLDSPAVTLAQWARQQPDATATDIPRPDRLGITTRPTCLTEWAWWLQQLNIHVDRIVYRGGSAYASGHRDGVVVQLQGDGVPDLLTDKAAARLAGVLAGHPF